MAHCLSANAKLFRSKAENLFSRSNFVSTVKKSFESGKDKIITWNWSLSHETGLRKQMENVSSQNATLTQYSIAQNVKINEFLYDCIHRLFLIDEQNKAYVTAKRCTPVITRRKGKFDSFSSSLMSKSKNGTLDEIDSFVFDSMRKRNREYLSDLFLPVDMVSSGSRLNTLVIGVAGIGTLVTLYELSSDSKREECWTFVKNTKNYRTAETPGSFSIREFRHGNWWRKILPC